MKVINYIVNYGDIFLNGPLKIASSTDNDGTEGFQVVIKPDLEGLFVGGPDVTVENGFPVKLTGLSLSLDGGEELYAVIADGSNIQASVALIGVKDSTGMVDVTPNKKCTVKLDVNDGPLEHPWKIIEIEVATETLESYWSVEDGALMGRDDTPYGISCIGYDSKPCCDQLPITVDFKYEGGLIGVAPVWEDRVRHTIATVAIVHQPEFIEDPEGESILHSECWYLTYHGVTVLHTFEEKPELVSATWHDKNFVTITVDGIEIFSGQPLLPPYDDYTMQGSGGDFITGDWKVAVITITPLFLGIPVTGERPSLRDLVVRCG